MASKRLHVRWFELRQKHRAKLIGGLLSLIVIAGLVIWYEWTARRYPDISAIGGPSAITGAVEHPPAVAQKREPPPEAKPQEPIAAAHAAEPVPVPAAPKAAPKKAKLPKAKAHPTPGRTVAGEFRWRHFGAAPYAATRAEAMRTRERAFRELGFPAPIVRKLMQVTQKPGERIRIVNGDRLSAMLSKGGAVHKNVVADFIKPPISGKMEYAAPAEEWRVKWHGRTHAVILPDVCNNWSRKDIPSASAPPVRSAAAECYELAFPATVGEPVNWGIATFRGPFPPDACNAQRQGELPWAAWYGDCPDCVPRGYRERSVPVPHHYQYPAVRKEQVLRFSKEVLESVVYLCVGEGACGVYVRPEDWKGRTRIEISPQLLASKDCR